MIRSCVCVCVLSTLMQVYRGVGYKSLASATFTAARPAVAGRVGVYTATTIPRGGLFLRERGISPPHVPHDVKKWTLFLILR
jgi:hypothetical protein